VPREAEVRVRGWPSLPPHVDPEKIAVATDAGVLGLFGIRQPHNQDPPLFPLLPAEIRVGPAEELPGPALVGHASGNDLWVLAGGRLHRYGLVLDPRQGLKAAPLWPKPLTLGTPLHAAHVNAAGDTLFLVTQRESDQTCLATAVEAETGQVRWQRQLGLVAQDEPAVLSEQVMVLDRGGGLFRFDPAVADAGQVIDQPDREPTAPPRLLLGDDGQSAYALTIFDQGRSGTVRHFRPGQEWVAFLVELPATPAGTPAIGAGGLVLPLANGNLYRQPLAKQKAGEVGPSWRYERAGPEALGHVVALGGDVVLVTDGDRELRRFVWPAGGMYERKGQLSLKARVAAAPVAVAMAEGKVLRVVAADVEGTLTLLQADDLKPLRRWDLGGKITAGPFLRGGRVGCVVEGHTVVWLDPERDEPAWKYRSGEAAVVGHPTLVNDLVVVADQGARVVALDSKTGQPVGPGYTLRADAVPAAAPVAYGKDRLLAPLSDGSVLVLTLDRLQATKPPKPAGESASPRD
jgi:outer membrane protein assembly factor BamB